jgi:alpha-methylacyl-CoA racemase
MRPLDGIKVIEMAGLAPTPYCGMILADFGADVVVVDRLSMGSLEIPFSMSKNPLDRGKRSIRVDLKTEEGIAIVKRQIVSSDVLLEPYRPGVMEKLGTGPDDALELNPKLIYARLTGWGQDGPYARMAGHDINYLALSGVLSLCKQKGEKPHPPCNLLADFAGGGMLCALGITLALFERAQSGKGQVVDTAMVDGASSFLTFIYGLLAHNFMTLDIGTNTLDGGAPYYQTYETADHKYMAVGAVEGRFYEGFVRGLQLDPTSLPDQNEKDQWPKMQAQFAEIFRNKTRDEWSAIFKGKDACVSPVLDLDEVDQDPHLIDRKSFINLNGALQPAVAPRLSRTPGRSDRPGRPRGSETGGVLEDLGYTSEEISTLLEKGIVEVSPDQG